MAKNETRASDPTQGEPAADRSGTPGGAQGAAQAGPRAQMVANPYPVEELYCDGVSGLFARGGVVKLDLFRALGVDPRSQAERRQVTHRLVLPLAAVPDVLRAFQTMVRAAQQATAASAGAGAGAASGDAVIAGDVAAEPGDVTLP